MTEGTLTEQFEASRSRLHLIAARMLGSSVEADDAVQETWLRASRSGVDDVDNVEGWLTTITSRVCLDALRSRTRAAERTMPGHASAVTVPGPEEDTMLADAIGPALLVVLDMLAPAERLAFVLHDPGGPEEHRIRVPPQGQTHGRCLSHPGRRSPCGTVRPGPQARGGRYERTSRPRSGGGGGFEKSMPWSA